MYTRTFVLFLFFTLYTFIIIFAIMSEKDRDRYMQGRGVQYFDDKIWIKTRKEIVYRGVREKFRQNPEFAEKLEKIGEEIIAECAVKDRIWGIGCSMKDENRFCIDRWRGQNLLGKILMQVRDDIRPQNKVAQVFQNAEKAFSGATEDAGFHSESELQNYVKKIDQDEEIHHGLF